MLKIMFWSDPPLNVHQPPTGYGKVAQYIIDGLSKLHEFAYTPMGRCNDMGIFKHGNVTFYPSGSTPFGEDVIRRNSYHWNADLVFILKDPFFMKTAFNYPLHYLYYAPVDHSPLHPHYEIVLKKCLSIVAMSRFGADMLETYGIKVDDIIPHGYDPHIYHPVYDEERIKCKRWFDVDPYCFLIGFIGRNQIRKQIDRLLLAFKHLLDYNSDVNVKLLLWTDVYSEVPIKIVIHKLGLHSKVYWPERKLYYTGIPEKDMWKFYNACDLIVCVSAEGFWLPGIEAMACGIPTMSPNYAAAREIAQFTVKVSDWTFNNLAGVKQPLIDLDDWCEKVLKIYDSDWEKLRRKQLEKAEKYEWKNIIPCWVKLFEKLESEVKPKIIDGRVEAW